MKPFAFKQAADQSDALNQLNSVPTAAFIAGGTNIIDLMKEGVSGPSTLIDISRLSLSVIRGISGGRVSIGALAKNSDTANHPLIRKNYPLLTKAILAGASPQIRNMATNGGNLLQRTRCAYFYDLSTPCNKRQSGSGCSAKDGLNRNHAIFGWSDSCVAVHPSDMCVALAALDATVTVSGPNGKDRSIKFVDFHRLPESEATKDNTLGQGELITAIELPASGFAQRYQYIKVRERSSYAFALVSAAIGLDVERGKVRNARIALGGVAPKPWRALEAEEFLRGKDASAANFEQAATIAVKDAKALSENRYKIEMARRTILRGLTDSMAQGGSR